MIVYVTNCIVDTHRAISAIDMVSVWIGVVFVLVFEVATALIIGSVASFIVQSILVPFVPVVPVFVEAVSVISFAVISVLVVSFAIISLLVESFAVIFFAVISFAVRSTHPG